MLWHPQIMGYGFVFVLDEASSARHAGERAVKSGGSALADGAATLVAPPADEPGAMSSLCVVYSPNTPVQMKEVEH